MKSTLLMLFAAGCACAQIPPAWSVSRVVVEQSTLQPAIDHQMVHGGKGSLHILPKKEPPAIPATVAQSVGNTFTLLQSIKADKYRGQRIRLSGYLRAPKGATGSLWLRVDGNQGVLGLANGGTSAYAMAHVVRNNPNWERTDQVVDVPADQAVGIAFGVVVNGLGEVWADDLKLEVVGKDVALTGLSARELEQINQNVHPTREQIALRLHTYEKSPLEPHNLGFEEEKQ